MIDCDVHNDVPRAEALFPYLPEYWMTAGGLTQRIEVAGGDGFYASSERRQFIGLGSAERIETLEIAWPSGQLDQWHDLPVDQTLVLVEGRGAF